MTAGTALRLDRNYLAGLGLILVAATCLALITTCAQFAYAAGSTPMTLVWLRIAAVLAVVAPIQLSRGRPLGLPLPLLRGTVGMAIALMMMSVGYLSAVAYISVSLAVILLYTFPLMVGLIAPLAGRDRMTWLKALCLLGTFSGLVIASAPSLGEATDWRGIAWALLAAAGVAGSVTFGASVIGKVDPLTVNLWSNIWMFGAASLFVLAGSGLDFPAGAAGWIGALGVAGLYVLGFGCVFTAMPKLPPARLALVLNLEPIISTLSAVLILGEIVTGQTWLGILIMLGFLTPATILGARSVRVEHSSGP